VAHITGALLACAPRDVVVLSAFGTACGRRGPTMPALMGWMGIGYMLSLCFESAVRWAIGPLIYVRDGVIILVVLLGYLDIVARKRDAVAPFGLLTFLVFGAFVSVASGLSAFQVLFGFKQWIGLLFGYLLVSGDAVHTVHRPRLWVTVWALLVAGVLLDIYINFPWAGMTMQVGDAQIEANREWTADGIARLSGFCRSSTDAACAILFTAFYSVVYLRSTTWRVVVWVLSGAGIVFTTSKGVILAFLIATILLPLLLSLRAEDIQFGSASRSVLCSVVVALAVLGLLLPAIVSQMTFAVLEQGTLESLLFSSFGERAMAAWPKAFALLESWQYVLGRGIGGIGAAQTYFEPRRYCAGDNLFVFTYVTGGLWMTAGYLASAFGVWHLDLTRRASALAYLLLMFSFCYGLFTSLVESGMCLIAVGACWGALALREHSPVPVASYRYSASRA
jgi:hypothetical protein